MYTKIQKSTYAPIFTPIFYLPNSTVAGIEVALKEGQTILSPTKTLQLIQSGNAQGLLEEIKQQLAKWQLVVGAHLYLTWKVCGKTTQSDLRLFIDQIGLVLPLNQLEIVFDCNEIGNDPTVAHIKGLIKSLPDYSIRKGLFHSRPLELVPNELDGLIDVLKLRKGLIMEIKEDLAKTTQCHELIENLVKRKVEIVIDDLFSKSDVTWAILMGAKYGQGYYLSRNLGPQKVIKTLKKKNGNDFYERKIDFLKDLVWA